MTSGTDLAGAPRTQGSSVDMGVYEDVAVSIWDGAASLGNGWRKLPWFGVFNDTFSPWINHAQLGWNYCIAEDLSDIWFYSPTLGWWWSSAERFPNTYRLSRRSWFYYSLGSSDPCWFYNWQTGVWETVWF